VTRRNLELLLLVIAAPLVIVLFAMLLIHDGMVVTVENLAVPLGIFGAFLVAHIAVRIFAPAADPAILPITFALSTIGIAFVTRIVPDMAVRQLMWLYAGIACMVLVLVFLKNIDRLAQYKYVLVLLGILLLLSPMLPVVGTEINGSRLWLRVGSFSFQPGELAKICIVLFLAGYLALNRELLSVFTWRVGPFWLPDLRTLMPMVVMWLLAFMVVVLEKDLGLALVLFAVFLVMLYCATGKKLYVVTGLLMAAVAAVALYGLFSHVQLRVSIWMDPFADAQNTSYQLAQCLFSIADGGMFGTGIGRGLGADIPIPYAYNDAIFAVIAEESGLLGAAGILLLYLSFAIRGMVVAARAKSDVSSLIAVGLTSVIVLQAFIIVGGITDLIPLTGITLPFIAQGGSSLLSSFIIVGILLRCGDEGPGSTQELMQTTGSISSNSVLGRVALGKRLTATMIFLSLLFVALVANLTWWMVINADNIQQMPGNGHTLAKQAEAERGTISTYDGVVLAQSIEENGHFQRVYPAGTLASHIVGYASQQYGTAGIEAAYNETLQGNQDFATWSDALNMLAGVGNPGNDVTLTINSKIQQAAQDALEGNVGACVVIDPKTGAMLGLASAPTYDAADFERLLSDAATNSSDSSALFNRATQALYAPGSTFKIVSLTAALEDGVATLDSTYDSPASIDIGNADVTNARDIAYGNITLARALEVSSNTVFGQVGEQLGAERLVTAAESFGFNGNPNFTLPLAKSLMPVPSEMTTWETAWAACGEPVGEHESPAGPQATVLEMALTGCAIANNGTIMTPYLVDGIYNANGERSFSPTPTVFKQATSAQTAQQVRDAMLGVVTNGTGYPAAINGVEVAGKTGTAENGDGTTNMWFVGMAPADNPQVVVAIVIEKGENSIAAYKAKDVLETSLALYGLL